MWAEAQSGVLWVLYKVFRMNIAMRVFTRLYAMKFHSLFLAQLFSVKCGIILSVYNIVPTISLPL